MEGDGDQLATLGRQGQLAIAQQHGDWPYGSFVWPTSSTWVPARDTHTRRHFKLSVSPGSKLYATFYYIAKHCAKNKKI